MFSTIAECLALSQGMSKIYNLIIGGWYLLMYLKFLTSLKQCNIFTNIKNSNCITNFRTKMCVSGTQKSLGPVNKFEENMGSTEGVEVLSIFFFFSLSQ
jgi:hypothetical protein